MKFLNRRLDLVLSGAIALAVFVLLNVWTFTGVHPYAWDDVAIAAGAVPQNSMLPGAGHYFAHLLFVVFPPSTAIFLNGLIAKLMVAGCGFMAYWIFRGMMVLVSGIGARDLRRRRIAVRIASATAAALFVFSDPMWHAAQGITGTTFVIALITVTLYLFVRLMTEVTFQLAIGTLTAVGFLCAESPLGWALLVLGGVATYFYLANVSSESWIKFLDPVRMQKTKWAMTFVFIGAFIAGVLFESFAFAMLDGMKAAGVTSGELPLLFVQTYFGLVANAADWPGYCVFLVVFVVPAALALLMVVPATDEDRFLSFKYSLVYFLVGLVAFLQLSPFDAFWSWSALEGVNIAKTPVAFGSLLSAMTVAFGLFVLGIEILCRDYTHIENVIYHGQRDDEQEADGEESKFGRVVASVPLTKGRIAMNVLPLVLVVIAVLGRRLPEDRKLCSIMAAYIDETLSECTGTKYVFTDGSYDSALRVEAMKRGYVFNPVSLMSGASHRDVYLRQMHSDDFEDRMSLEAGAAEALRTWVMAKSERLSDVSVQIAFELFRLNRRLEPIVYGLMVRPAGGNSEDAAKSVTRCRALSDAIVAAHESGTWRHAKDSYLKDRFLFAQFRLAVMSRLRAIALDAKKMVKESLEEIAYADRLNMNNPSLVKILRHMDWVKRQSGEALTPREGLEVAMKRADFVMARRYAMPVLKQDPDEPNANFAVGMSYYAEEQFAKAEEYLKRVLKKNPDEPAVYNNIALICLKTGRLEEASKNAARALKLKPDSPEIKDTVSQIDKVKAEKSSRSRFPSKK